jgi:hypothetical protein
MDAAGIASPEQSIECSVLRLAVTAGCFLSAGDEGHHARKRGLHDFTRSANKSRASCNEDETIAIITHKQAIIDGERRKKKPKNI